MLTLRSAPYSLQPGVLVQAKVRAYTDIVIGDNQLNPGALSSWNIDGAYVEAPPPKPDIPVQRDPTTSDATTIGVSYGPLNLLSTGGTIISYELQWDQGTGNWVSLKGYDSDLTDTTHFEENLTTESSYSFMYRAKNDQGWGPFSDPADFISAAPPSAPSTVETTNENDKVKVAWQEPANGGAEILAYKITFKRGDSDTYEELAECDGTDNEIVSSLRYCLVPMSSLINNLLLTEGTIVIAKVGAINEVDLGDITTSSDTIGAEIQVAPHKPDTVVIRSIISTESRLVVYYGPIPEALNGGSEIQSVHLEYSNSEFGTYTSLVGFNPYSLETTYILHGAIAGTTYYFRTTTRNIYGWSDPSDASAVIAGGVPNKPNSVQTTLVGTDVVISITPVISSPSVTLVEINIVAETEIS
jgi:hypothetical protein